MLFGILTLSWSKWFFLFYLYQWFIYSGEIHEKSELFSWLEYFFLFLATLLTLFVSKETEKSNILPKTYYCTIISSPEVELLPIPIKNKMMWGKKENFPMKTCHVQLLYQFIKKYNQLNKMVIQFNCFRSVFVFLWRTSFLKNSQIVCICSRFRI